MNEWITAAIAVGAGLVLGTLGAQVARRLLSKSKVAALQDSSGAVAGLVLALFFVGGLIVALGVVSPDDVDRLRADAVAFVPRAISALIIVIIGNVVATLASDTVARSMRGVGSAARFAPMATRIAVLVSAGVVAAAQAGMDTAIVQLGVAAVLFGISGIAVLLAGFGGRQVASEVAASRAVRRQLQPGDRVRIDGVRSGDDPAERWIEGIVVDVSPTAVELYADGSTVLVPNSQLLRAVIERSRPQPADAYGELAD